MSTETTEITNRIDQCHHCHGSGHEPGPALTDEQRAILEKIVEVGDRLATVSAARTEPGRVTRRQCYSELRALVPAAQSLGLYKPRIAAAAGLGRQGLHNILTHQTEF